MNAALQILLRMVHRYTRDPESRVQSSRQILICALRLHADHTSTDEAAKVAVSVLCNVDERRAAG